MTACPSCLASCSPGDVFCDACGRRLGDRGTTSDPTCTACGVRNHADDVFCCGCGARLGAPVANAPTGQAAVARPAPATTAARVSTPAAVVPARASGGHPSGAGAGALPPPARGGTRPTGGPAVSHDATTTLVVVPRGQRELARVAGSFGVVLEVSPDDALESVQRSIAKSRPSAVCLVGAPWDLPMPGVADPTGKDEGVPTDNFYGMTSTPSEDERFVGRILPEVPVGRVPTTDANLLRQILAAESALVPRWTPGIAVSASTWRGASEAVLECIAPRGGPRLMLAPPRHEGDVAESMGEQPGRLYFNVHGTDQEPMWVGDDGRGAYPAVVRPKHVRVASRAIVASEACYGAALFEGEEAISTAFLAGGAGCFVGSTIIAWGPAAAPPSLADLIVVGLYRGLDMGMSAGEALLAAKRALLEAAEEDGEPLSPQLHNTLLSFVLYGSPNARVEGVARSSGAKLAMPGGRRGSAKAGAVGAGGSVLDQTRARLAGIGRSTVGDARERLRGRLAPGDWQALSRGRLQLAELSTQFRSGAQLEQRIQHLLGVAPKGVEVFRYRASTVGRASISAAEKTPWGTKHVAIVVDDDGEEIDAWVSR